MYLTSMKMYVLHYTSAEAYVELKMLFSKPNVLYKVTDTSKNQFTIIYIL